METRNPYMDVLLKEAETITVRMVDKVSPDISAQLKKYYENLSLTPKSQASVSDDPDVILKSIQLTKRIARRNEEESLLEENQEVERIDINDKLTTVHEQMVEQEMKTNNKAINKAVDTNIARSRAVVAKARIDAETKKAGCCASLFSCCFPKIEEFTNDLTAANSALITLAKPEAPGKDGMQLEKRRSQLEGERQKLLHERKKSYDSSSDEDEQKLGQLTFYSKLNRDNQQRSVSRSAITSFVQFYMWLRTIQGQLGKSALAVDVMVNTKKMMDNYISENGSLTAALNKFYYKDMEEVSHTFNDVYQRAEMLMQGMSSYEERKNFLQSEIFKASIFDAANDATLTSMRRAYQ